MVFVPRVVRVFSRSSPVCHQIYVQSKRMTSETFIGKMDVHKGVTVSSAQEPCPDSTEFNKKLEASLRKWHEEKLRGIWFRVAINHVQWIPILAQNGFVIHHAKGDTITMCRWIERNEINRIPNYAHTMVGVGAVIINDKNQVLTVQERYREIPFWKLPGGYVDPGEDIVEAAQREVLEETNVQTEYESLLSFRHSFQSVFDCTDLYFIVKLKPKSLDIVRQKEEVDDCVWMNVEEFLNHPQVHENNRLFVRIAVQSSKDQVAVVKDTTFHPITKKAQALYFVSKTIGKNRQTLV